MHVHGVIRCTIHCDHRCIPAGMRNTSSDPIGPAALMSTAFGEAMMATPSLQRSDEGIVHSTCITDHNGFKFDSSHLTAVGAEGGMSTIAIQTF